MSGRPQVAVAAGAGAAGLGAGDAGVGAGAVGEAAGAPAVGWDEVFVASVPESDPPPPQPASKAAATPHCNSIRRRRRGLYSSVCMGAQAIDRPGPQG